jgi:lactate permease
LPVDRLSAGIGRICAPVSLFIPGYLVLVMGGWRALRGVMPAAIACGVSFAGMQFLVSNFLGPQLTDLASSLAAIVTLVIVFLVWKPKDAPVAEEANSVQHTVHEHSSVGTAVLPAVARYTASEILIGWSPYLLLVAFVLLWGWKPMQAPLNSVTMPISWPSLHNQILKMPPVSTSASPYAAVFTFNWLSASGTACMLATLASALVLRISLPQFGRIFISTVRQLALSLLTLAAVLGLAFLMNYSGATGTLGLAFAATGAAFPFFSAILGWVGVFLTGSDTSANALFGNLQVVTASKLGLNPVLMAASNSSGGVMGKMISLSSIAVAAAATGMPRDDEAKLFRFTLRHSVLMAAVIGAIVLLYAYAFPSLAP